MANIVTDSGQFELIVLGKLVQFQVDINLTFPGIKNMKSKVIGCKKSRKLILVHLSEQATRASGLSSVDGEHMSTLDQMTRSGFRFSTTEAVDGGFQPL